MICLGFCVNLPQTLFFGLFLNLWGLDSMDRYKENASLTVDTVIKYVGFFTMVIDHIGLFFFPENMWFRIIGRLALPCFLYSMVNGVRYTSSVNRYAGRLFLMGAVSLIAWWRILPLNIGFTLGFSVLGLRALKEKDGTGVLLFGLLSSISEYSLYAYLLAIIMFLWLEGYDKKRLLGFTVILHGLVGIILPTQVFALGFIFVWLLANEWVRRDRSVLVLDRWVSYSFYPLHVFILRVLSGS